MPMPQQLPQVAILGVRHPDPREPVFHQQAATIAAHPDGPSSACVPASCESRPDLRSTTRTRVPATNARTSGNVRWTPYPLAPLDLAASVPGKTAPPLRDAPSVVRSVHLCQYRCKQFVGSPDDNHIL